MMAGNAPETPSSGEVRQTRIMVVDDAMTIRLYCRQILESAGFIVDEALNGLEAIEKALIQPCDLFLVDINMLGMDGYSMLRLIRRDPVLGAIPAVMVSTESKESDQIKAFEAGANLYLIKPLSPDQLLLAAAMMTGRPTP
ncbi:Two-component system, chemotaxis family, response regulator CheY [Azospirillaceae bacterium]